MLNLRQYKNSADTLADHLPWAALVAPGVVLNKDGSLQRSFRYCGPDLESSTPTELVAFCARVNNALRRLGSGWAFFFEAQRIPALGYPEAGAGAGVSRLIDQERRAAFEDVASRHFESRYFLTLVLMPGADMMSSAGQVLVEAANDAPVARDWKTELSGFIERTDGVVDLLAGIMPSIEALGDDDVLTYLHDTVSTRHHTIKRPDVPMYLDTLLVDTPLFGGMQPVLGDEHTRTLTLIGFPNQGRSANMLPCLGGKSLAAR